MSLLHQIEPRKGGHLVGVAKPVARECNSVTPVTRGNTVTGNGVTPPRNTTVPPASIDPQLEAVEAQIADIRDLLDAVGKRLAELEARAAVLTVPPVAPPAATTSTGKKSRAAYMRARRAKQKAAQP